MDDNVGMECLLQFGYHAVAHQPIHLKGHARKRHQYLALTLKPHAGGGAEVVVEHFAAGGHEGLGAVDGCHFVAAALEDAAHVLQRHLALDEFALEVVAKQFLGDVVLGGAEATGYEHRVRRAHGLVDSVPDVLVHIAHHHGAPHRHARLGQHPRHGRGVGVHHLPDEQLVADVDDCCFHSAILFPVGSPQIVSIRWLLSIHRSPTHAIGMRRPTA